MQRDVRLVTDRDRRTLLAVARMEAMRVGVSVVVVRLVLDVVPERADRSADRDRSAVEDRDAGTFAERHREVRIETVRRTEAEVDRDHRARQWTDPAVREQEEVAERDLDGRRV